jgi:DNA-binding response OmpR family regulator
MRLLLVEDEPDLAIAVQTTLRRHEYVVDWVEDGLSAWEYLQQPGVYTLAIVDWMVPELSGLALCQRLRSQQNALPVLMLTARDRLEDRVAGLDAGADDYLVKPFGMEELLARIRALLRRPAQLQSPIMQVGQLTLDCQNHTVSVAGKTAQVLHLKEFQLLEYLMQHPQQTLTHDQIRSRLWDMHDESVSNVVAAQIRLLRKKLEQLGVADRVETVRGFGYRFNPHDDHV